MKKWILALAMSLVLSSRANAELAGYWNFDEGDGVIAYDSSAYGNNGTLSDAGVNWVEGREGSALEFDGANGYVKIPDSNSLDLTTGLTIEAWIKPYTFTGGGRDIVSKWAVRGSSYIFKLHNWSDGHQSLEIANNVAPGARSNHPVVLNAWQHVAVTYDMDKVRFYINGNLDSEYATSRQPVPVTDAAVLIGCVFENLEFFSGIIDNVYIYNNALTQDEIVRDMGPPIGNPPVADAGADISASANKTITLDGSNSSDPEGIVTAYEWVRLPDNVILCPSSSSPVCKIKSLGRAEEFIQLSITDNDWNTAVDAVSIFHKMPAVCGDEKIEDDEICDGNSISCLNSQGYSGTQYCNEQCSAFGDCIVSQSCGDGQVNGNEVCDKNSQGCTIDGYAGTQVCNAQCSGFNACNSNQFCGDGQVNGNEVCDANTQSCTTTAGYAGTKTCNQQCSGFGDCVSSLFCGDKVINGSEVCDANTKTCTTTSGYAGTQSCNAQCTGFEACTSSLRCGDGICTAPPETSSNCSQDCSTAFSVTLEAENMPTKTVGGPITDGWYLWSKGYVEDTVQFPATGVYQFDIIAKGDRANNVWPNMDVKIDQSRKASVTVNSSTWAKFTVQISVTQGSHKVAIAFTNDYYVPPADRNLYVDKVTIKK